MCAEIAQLVERRTENPCVPSSILGLGILFFAGVAQLVEQRFRKSWVGGSIPLASFFAQFLEIDEESELAAMARQHLLVFSKPVVKKEDHILS